MTGTGGFDRPDVRGEDVKDVKVTEIMGTVTRTDGTTSAFSITADLGWQQWAATQQVLGTTVYLMDALVAAAADHMGTREDEDEEPEEVFQTYEVTCHVAPTQVEGRYADGRPFYFRARHGVWNLTVGEPDAEISYLGMTLVADGDDATIGAMDLDEVRRIITDNRKKD